ncbi:OPT oligopeptide transporter protein-domain-containing protein [Armillaria fumosa]|nr:OPT oligopeptide transporter protein-domain-containing protein [Armillaria fumosa]
MISEQSKAINATVHKAGETRRYPRWTYNIVKLLSFAHIYCYNLSLRSAVTYVLLWHWRELQAAFGGLRFLKRGHADIDDPHYAEMKKYKEVRNGFTRHFAFSLGVAIGTSYAGPGGYVLIPAWSVIFFTVFSFFMATLLGFITATTGFNISLKYVVDIIAAFIHPGEPFTVMYANFFGNSTAWQTLYMLQDLKLGQYTKLPPRITFAAQMTPLEHVISPTPTPISSRFTLFFVEWIEYQSVNSASAAMGALGKELFTYWKESGYWIIPFGMFIGLFCPIPFWVIHRYSKPGSALAKTMKYIDIPIVTLYIGYLPYSVNGKWRSCFVIGFFSQWRLRKHRSGWFKKYNYLTSAALDGGSQVIFILSFAVFGASNKAVDFPFWWTDACRRDGREDLTSIRGKCGIWDDEKRWKFPAVSPPRLVGHTVPAKARPACPLDTRYCLPGSESATLNITCSALEP